MENENPNFAEPLSAANSEESNWGMFAHLSVLVAIAGLALVILATVTASKGQMYRYPFSLRLVKSLGFRHPEPRGSRRFTRLVDMRPDVPAPPALTFG